MHSDMSTLSSTVNSLSSSIKSLDGNMGQLAALIYSNPNEDLVLFMTENQMNVSQVSAIVTRSGKTLQERRRPNNEDAQRVVADNESPKYEVEAKTEEIESYPKLYVWDGDVATPTTLPKIKINPSFPQLLKKKDDNPKFQKKLGIVKDLKVHIPFNI
ncbi:hypothetical protein KY290_003560 [Solanum tuberosum]|uniref:Integrase core domain containing protein n=1 Tax=Solanum tuberosum TaxID=4113 RepID=A0ABQ7WVE6_SOLTU|nr:hypothetical protein KY290_003560 [Solanum tuberosum]